MQPGLHNVRPGAYHRVDAAEPATDRKRRVPGTRHRDQRPVRRRLRVDRSRGGTGRRRRAARPVVVAGRHRVAASAGNPAVHRDHPGDGRRRAGAGRGAADALPTSGWAGDGGPQRVVRSSRAPPGLRAHRPGVAVAAGSVHGRPGTRAAAPTAGTAADRAGRRAGHRGLQRPSCAGRRRDVRTCAVCPVSSAVRERSHGCRRGCDAGAATASSSPAASSGPRRRGRALAWSAALGASATRVRPAATRPRRLPVSRPARSHALRGQVDFDPQPGAGPLRARRRPGAVDRARRDRRLPVNPI